MVLRQKFITIFLIIFVKIFVLAYLLTFLLTPLNTIIKFDQKISRPAKKNISEYLKVLKIGYYDAKRVKNIIEEKFIKIDSLEIFYNGSRTAIITIKMPELILDIKDIKKGKDFALTNKGIVSALDYKTERIEQLNTVFVDSDNIEKELEDPEFYNCVSKLPQELFLDYKIVWSDKTKIMLISNKFCLQIVSNYKSIFKKHRISKSELIYKSTGTTALKADIRFKDFIICSNIRGGPHEKTAKK